MDEEKIFLKAVAIGAPDRRAEFLEEACGQDEPLRRSVEALLRHHKDAGSFLEKPPEALVATIARGNFETGAEHSELSLDFLQPSEKPGCLGTVGGYEVIEMVGHGGMGIVARAFDTKLNRVVAIKSMAPALAANAMAVKRFLREARAAAAVSHNHVVTIHAIEEEHRPPFIVMEFVAGESLQEKLDRRGPFPVEDILRIGMQMAQGLAAAHAQGLVHRDIKPANILLENGVERVKITDFGLARAADDVSVTRTGQIAGTPQYMSPEQARGHAVDARSDLFSLGSVLYAMCTGRPPFRAESPLAMLRRVSDETPRGIQQLNAEVPEWLEAIIFKLLAKDPDERFQSATEVAEQLGAYLAYLQNPGTAPPPRELLPPVRPQLSEAGRASKPTSFAELETPPTRRGLHFLGRVSGAGFWFGIPAVVAVAFAVLAAVVFYLQTNYGVIRVEVLDAEARVVVTRGDRGQVLEIHGRDEILRVRPGDASLRIHHGDVEFETQEFAVRRGEQIVVRVSRVQDDLVVRAGHRVIARRELPGAGRGPVRVQDDAALGKAPTELLEVIGKSGVHYRVALDRGSQRILTSAAHDDAARLWDLTSGRQVREFSGTFGAAAFSPDGRRVYAGTHHPEGGPANELIVWDSESGDKLQTLEASTGVFADIAVSPDGRFAASAHGQWWDDFSVRDNTVRIWDLQTSKVLHEIREPGSSAQIDSVAFTPDGKRVVSCGGDGKVRLWDVETGARVRQFQGTDTRGFAVDVSPDGQFVLAGFGPDSEQGVTAYGIDDPEHCIAIMWNLETGEEVQRFVGHHGAIKDVGFSPDGKLVVTGSGAAYVGEVRPGDSNYRTSDDKTMRLWNAQTGEQLAVVLHQSTVGSVAFSPDGRYLLSGETQLFHVWRAPGVDRNSVANARQGTRQLAVSSNRDGNFDIYLVQDDGSGWHNLTRHPAEDSGPAWSPDGERIAFCSDRSGNLDVWVMNADGSDPRQLTDYEGIDRTPCWSPDGSQLAFVRHLPDDNWEVFVMDADGSNQVNLSNHPHRDADPAWSPDGTKIAYDFHAEGGGRLYVMSPDGSEQRMLSPRPGSFIYPAWSPDSHSIVFTAWTPRVGEQLELFVARSDGSHERQLTQLGGLNTFASFSPDGKRIAFQHRKPNRPGTKATVYVMNADGTGLQQITGQEAHIGFGGGRPAWRPRGQAQE